MSFEAFEKLPAEKQETILAAGIREFSEKTYQEANTDRITKECGISKGILFHYFGSKKQFYLYCIQKAMDRLTEVTEEAEGSGFYDILFDEMDRKMSLCMKYRYEMHLMNTSSRDMCRETAADKAALMKQYSLLIQSESERTVRKALSVLKIKKDQLRAAEGMRLYISAVMNKNLLMYLQTPDLFFEDSEMIKKEMKEYLDLMLYGILDEE